MRSPVAPRSLLNLHDAMTTEALPAEVFAHQCRQAHQLVQAYLDDKLPPPSKPGYVADPAVKQRVKQRIRQLMAELSQALDDVSDVAMSYNGGKDCLVMVVLILAVLYTKTLPPNYQLDSVYINAEVEFQEVGEFIRQLNQRLGLRLVPIKAHLKQGFQQYLDANPQINRIIIGIRRSDPYGATLKFAQATDGDWPRFTRLHPILDWTYVDVWAFLVETGIDYCPMYDQGYTSLGGRDTTVPNPFLKRDDGTYAPAYMLTEDADARERLGRCRYTECQRLNRDVADPINNGTNHLTSTNQSVPVLGQTKD